MDSRCSLSLFERLSQAYLHKYTIILVIIMLKMYLMKKSLLNDFDDLSDQANNFCSTLNNFSSELSSLPTQISAVLNSAIVSYLNHLRNSWVLVIHVLVTVVKNLLIFYVTVFLGTYTCLLNAAVSGTANFALDSSRDIIRGVNSTVVRLTDGIDDALGGISRVVNEVVDAYEDLRSFVSGDDDNYNIDDYKSTINLRIDSLKNLSIPSSVLSDIDKFKRKVPSFDELQNSTRRVISSPFDLILREIENSSRSKNDTSIRDLPSLRALDDVKICENVDTIEDQIDKLAHVVSRTSTMIMLALLIIILFSLVFTCLVEYIHWRKEMKLVDHLRESGEYEDVLQLHNNTLMNLTDKCLPSAFHNPARNRVLWVINYSSSKYGYTVLSFGILGLLSVLLQYLMVRNLNFEVDLVSRDFGQAFRKQSISYMRNINDYLNKEQAQLNDETFGFITNSSESLNSTINDMLVTINDTVSAVFEDTPFESPVSSVVYCTIGSKLVAMERGLTWLHDNLKFTVPTFSENLISTNLAINNYSMNSINDYINNAFHKIIKMYKDSLQFELKIAILFLLVWVLQILIAVTILLIKYLMDAKKSRKSEIFISKPKQLTEIEKQVYGYPLSNITEHNKANTSSSVYDSSSMDTFTSRSLIS